MTRLFYISVCLRTRQDTIYYSFTCIVQKLAFHDIRTDDWKLETEELRLETGDWKLGNGDRKLETGNR